jgi:hypothetical protein
MLVESSGPFTAVTGAIRQAAQVTGADFRYLLATAQVESNLNPKAKVATSSARGLFQFIEQTWLGMLKQEGPALGYGRYAGAIARTASGRYVVTDPSWKAAIMNLRADPTANAVMAGAFTRQNAAHLGRRLGRAPTEGELYIAHFLGAGGASRLIRAAESKPLARAAEIFPGAAKANRSIFYDKQGHARSASAVYRVLVGRYQVARGGQPSPTAAPVLAANGGAQAGGVRPPPPLSLGPGEFGEAPAPARVSAAPAPAADPPAVFDGLSRRGSHRNAVAPMVTALWGAPVERKSGVAAAVAVPAPGSSSSLVAVANNPAAPAGASGVTLDLFQERPPNVRALFRGGA